MKKNYIVKLLFVVFIAVVGFISCNSKTGGKEENHQHDETAQEYTCPMHPKIVEDKPGSCPICGMELVPKNSHTGQEAADTSLAYLMKPVNEQVIASIPVIRAQQGTRIFQAEVQGRITYDTRNKRTIANRVSGRIERLLIKYNYQPVKKGQLIMEVYSPDLAAAQRELLFIKNTGNEEGMLEPARERLLLLGMNANEIDRMLKTGKISYRVPVYSNTSGYILEQSAASAPSSPPTMSTPAAGGSGMNSMGASSAGGSKVTSTSTAGSSSPVLIREGEYVSAGQAIFTIYQTGSLVAEFALNASDAAHITKNAKILIHRQSDTTVTYTGIIGLIQPTFSESENFTLVRVYLKNNSFTVGELVAASIPVKADKGWWLPKEAVVFLGNKAVVLKKENKVFIPKEVTAGLTVKGQVQILDDVSEWQIASNAQYLIDSESFIKTQNGL